MSGTIILGDIHLGKGEKLGKTSFGTGINSRVNDQINLLNWTLDQAIDLGAKRIIITGDVFEDPKPNPSLVRIFLDWLKKCEAYSVSVSIIYGNHDILRSGQQQTSVLDIINTVDMENVHVHNSIDTIICDGVAYTLMPFRDRRSFDVDLNAKALDLLKEKLVYELADIPNSYLKVLIGHFAIDGSLYVGDEIDDASNEIFCPVNMFTEYDYVWMGHVHKPQVMNKSKPYVAHVGSMDRSDVGESDHKKIIIYFNPSIEGYFKEIEIPVRPLEKITVQVPAEIEDTTEYVIDSIKKFDREIKNGIIKIDIQLLGQNTKSVDRKEIEGFLSKEGVFNVASFSETKKISLLKKKDDSISHVISESTAIKEWSEKFISEELRARFVAVAEEIKLEAKNSK